MLSISKGSVSLEGGPEAAWRSEATKIFSFASSEWQHLPRRIRPYLTPAAPLIIRMGFIPSLIRKIGTKYPMIAPAIQAGGLMALGDLISQGFIEKRSYENWNAVRTLRFGAVGFFGVGPTLRVWYGILERRISFKSNFATAFVRMGVDQFVFAPVFIGVFLSIMEVTQGHNLEETKKNVIKNYFDVLTNNYKLWPAVQLANFLLVPIHLRVLFVQCFAIIWNTYLSWKTNTTDRSTHDVNNAKA